MGQLTDRKVKTVGEGRHTDGEGLYLVVSSNGNRKWVFRYQIDGSRRDMGLGSYPDVSLSDARVSAGDARKLIAKGGDPVEEKQAAKKAAKPIPTFREIAALVIAESKAKSTNAKVRYQWDRHLGPDYSGPLLERPVNEITTSDVAAVLKPIWRTKPEVSRKLLPAIRKVFEHARVKLRDEHAIDMPHNPARWDDLKAMGFEAPAKLTRGNFPSLPYLEVPAFFADLRAREAIAAMALELLILTNVRTDAVLKAQPEQFDLEQEIWNVPLVSLKDRKYRKEAFRVPLSPRAIKIVRKMLEGVSSKYLFPGQKPRKPLSNMAMLTLLGRMNHGDAPKWIDPVSKRAIVPHGFRASFRTWAEETTNFPHATIEEAMGHQVGTEVERAYRRTDMLKKRRALMQAWANYCEPKAAKNVVRLVRSVADA
jgi:integrase